MVRVSSEALQCRKKKTRSKWAGKVQASTEQWTALDSPSVLRPVSPHSHFSTHALSPLGQMLLYKLIPTILGVFACFPSLISSLYLPQRGPHLGKGEWKSEAVFPCVPEFLQNSFPICTFHYEHLIHFILEYPAGVGDVHSSLYGKGNTVSSRLVLESLQCTSLNRDSRLRAHLFMCVLDTAEMKFLFMNQGKL